MVFSWDLPSLSRMPSPMNLPSLLLSLHSFSTSVSALVWVRGLEEQAPDRWFCHHLDFWQRHHLTARQRATKACAIETSLSSNILRTLTLNLDQTRSWLQKLLHNLARRFASSLPVLGSPAVFFHRVSNFKFRASSRSKRPVTHDQKIT